MRIKRVLINISAVGFITWLMISFSCNGNKTYYGIPDVYVNMMINMNLPLYNNLNVSGGFHYFPDEGFRGVLVYHNLDDNFIALECCCTYHALEECAEIKVDQSGIFLRCGHYEGVDFVECCGSRYDMTGINIQGPALYPLKRYNVYRDGQTIYVNN